MTKEEYKDTQEQAFERQAIVYEQNFEQFRDLNRLMWQVPMLAVTITGGFWYAALTIDSAEKMARSLYLMCGVLDFCLVFVLLRIRYVMSMYLEKLRAFNPADFVEAKGTCPHNRSHVVVTAFSVCLLAASVLSIGKFFVPNLLVDWP